MKGHPQNPAATPSPAAGSPNSERDLHFRTESSKPVIPSKRSMFSSRACCEGIYNVEITLTSIMSRILTLKKKKKKNINTDINRSEHPSIHPTCQPSFCVQPYDGTVAVFLPILFFSPAAPRGMWDLSSLTRDQTRTPCSGSTES